MNTTISTSHSSKKKCISTEITHHYNKFSLWSWRPGAGLETQPRHLTCQPAGPYTQPTKIDICTFMQIILSFWVLWLPFQRNRAHSISVWSLTNNSKLFCDVLSSLSMPCSKLTRIFEDFMRKPSKFNSVGWLAWAELASCQQEVRSSAFVHASWGVGLAYASHWSILLSSSAAKQPRLAWNAPRIHGWGSRGLSQGNIYSITWSK